MTFTPFAEFAVLLLVAAGAGALFVQLRQPVLIAYIVVGIALGPAGLGWVKAHDEVALLAQIGVTVLLFIVGLKLDLHHVRHIGPVALATGLGQLAFTIAGGFVLILALGKDVMTALYVAVALTFSSTIIIVKLLTDKRELDALHGRIAVGFLIVQDLAVVLAMMAMSALRPPEAGEAASAWMVAASLVGRIVLAVLIIAALMRWVLPRVVALMARSQELLLIFALAWGVGLAALGDWAGFSMEAGAFVAGFTLASTHFREAINARLGGVRDFLLLFFFIHLGAELNLSTLGQELWPALVLAVFVLIGNPLIVMAIMGYMGYRKRTGFLAGLTVAQISEFSIVFVAMGISLGHLDVQALGLTTLVGLITITLSTYMILYSHPLYERLAPWLGVFERKRPHRELAVDRHPPRSDESAVLVFGLGRYGSRLLGELRRLGVAAAGIDHDPEAVRELKRQGLPVHYGDAENPDFVESLALRATRWVVVTLPLVSSTRALVHALRGAGYAGPIAVTARDEASLQELQRLDAQHIYLPFRDAAVHAAEHLLGVLTVSPPASGANP
ncbi:MAG: cation:proton antiporter [Tepidimonas sp.]|uniref:cation:proton antiporter n=1 Tax=Tepidimonas sp. TaxID=2002775 RepID=UPI00259DFC1F|nr:cation:proton antiporter family protein [Tepidimonas sp.]MDM7456109.1 cation:proton antiporter [Tepidimonas sp.]